MTEETSKPNISCYQNRFRLCVVCDKTVEHNYSTSFTSVQNRQIKWVDVLMRGDPTLSQILMDKVSKGRKYICFDHFDKNHIRTKEDGKMEVIRNSVPIPFEKITPIFEVKTENDTRIEEKMFTILVDACNHYIEKAMNKV